MSDDVVTGVSGYSFAPPDLNPAQRREGISAFMRIKNGAEFLEATIRSHIDEVDEIVAVFNNCTDATETILRTMRAEYGPKLRIFHYQDRVFPPGSEGHKTTDPSSPHSIVNYSNFALAQTKCTIVTKLDDDHLAIEQPWRALARQARQNLRQDQLLAFSGINLIHPKGQLSAEPQVLLNAPISGKGDIGFFRISDESFFHHDPRFERFAKNRSTRQFGAFTYWHLKFLKRDVYGNYELAENPNSRFARLRDRLDDFDSMPFDRWLRKAGKPRPWRSLMAAMVDKEAIARDQRRQLRAGRLRETPAKAMLRLSSLQNLSSSSLGPAP
ncbi:MAG: glycosyl transferase [Pseudomonadota bacterium]